MSVHNIIPTNIIPPFLPAEYWCSTSRPAAPGALGTINQGGLCQQVTSGAISPCHNISAANNGISLDVSGLIPIINISNSPTYAVSIGLSDITVGQSYYVTWDGTLIGTLPNISIGNAIVFVNTDGPSPSATHHLGFTNIFYNNNTVTNQGSEFALTVTTTDFVPSIPINLAVTSVTTSSLTASWSVGAGGGGGITSYTLQYKKHTDVSFTQINGIVTSTKTVSGLSAGTLYDFQVSAINAVGASSFTATVSNATTYAYGPIPIFPTLPIGFPLKMSPVLDTIVGTTKSLREMRVAQRRFPLWDFEILFEELRDQTQNQTPYAPFAGYQQFETLVQTWLMMYGQTNVFAFDCPWDDSRSNQFIANGDGSTVSFPIVRTWGVGSTATLQPVGIVNSVTQVQVNGVTVPSSNYYINRNTIVFQDSGGGNHPPGNGLAITMTFSYYYLCRFVEDEQDYEEFAKNRWSVKSLKFRSVYWP